MTFDVDDEFRNICQQIMAEDFTAEQWREVESDDAEGKEWWFQLTLCEVQRVLMCQKIKSKCVKQDNVVTKETAITATG